MPITGAFGTEDSFGCDKVGDCACSKDSRLLSFFVLVIVFEVVREEDSTSDCDMRNTWDD